MELEKERKRKEREQEELERKEKKRKAEELKLEQKAQGSLKKKKLVDGYKEGENDEIDLVELEKQKAALKKAEEEKAKQKSLLSFFA